VLDPDLFSGGPHDLLPDSCMYAGGREMGFSVFFSVKMFFSLICSKVSSDLLHDWCLNL
jgi:hypothetical protein